MSQLDKNKAGDWLPYYPEDFVIHEVPSSLLEAYMSGERVMSCTTHEQITRPGGLYLKQMQHERHELDRLSLYRVRLIWSRQ